MNCFTENLNAKSDVPDLLDDVSVKLKFLAFAAESMSYYSKNESMGEDELDGLNRLLADAAWDIDRARDMGAAK